MRENVFAMTETDYQPDYYPGFVSLNQEDDQSITLSVRSRGKQDVSTVKVSWHDMDLLCDKWTNFRNRR